MHCCETCVHHSFIMQAWYRKMPSICVPELLHYSHGALQVGVDSLLKALNIVICSEEESLSRSRIRVVITSSIASNIIGQWVWTESPGSYLPWSRPMALAKHSSSVHSKNSINFVFILPGKYEFISIGEVLVFCDYTFPSMSSLFKPYGPWPL